MRTLVLDDEQRYREHMKHRLERQGWRIEAAGTTVEAAAIVREGPLDLMIVDIKLSEPMDGLDFAAWARTQHPETDLIVITGFGSPDHERRSRELGAVAYLEKPFDLAVLESHVRRQSDTRLLRQRLRDAETAQAAARQPECVSGLLEAVSLACVSATGEVLFTTRRGAEDLAAVVDPNVPRPLQRIDDDLLRLLQTAPERRDVRRTVALRRDGVLAHFFVEARQTQWGSTPALALVFLDSMTLDQSWMDELWIPLVCGLGGSNRGRELGGS